MKVFRYMRYSSDNQTETSIECQKRETQAYCDENGYEILCDFIDRGYTGTNDKRPDFQRMIDMIKQRSECDAVLVYDYSRFSRDLQDSYHYLKILRDNKVKLLSVIENIDSNDDTSILHQFLVILQNQNFSKMLSTKTSDGLKNKALKGEHCGGVPPLGYNVDVTGMLVIDEEEAASVKIIFNMFEQGRSYKQIADYLNENNYTTKSGNPFCKNSFSSILTQEKYIGRLRYNRATAKDTGGHRNNHASKPEEEQIILEGGCPKIISKEQFERVQRKLKERASGKASSKSRQHYMLGGMGILHCSACGRAMVGEKIHSGKKTYDAYTCPNHRYNNGCDTLSVKCEEVNKFVATLIVKHFVKKSSMEEINRGLHKADPHKELVTKKKRLRKTIMRLTKAIVKSPSESLAREITKYEAIVADIDVEIQNHIAIEPFNEKSFRKARNNLVNYLKSTDSYIATQLIMNVIKEVRIGNDGVEVILQNC